MSEVAAVCVVIAVMYGIARGSWPGLSVNRAAITVIGAALLLALGTITPAAAWQAIDLSTLIILAGMMVINGVLEEAGVFAAAAHWLGASVGHGATLLAVLMVTCAAMSALFLNDTVVFLLTPLVVVLAQHCRVAPIPLLLGIATSANIGSALTITGNPQNIVIGAAAGIGFVPFALQMAPVVGISLVIAYAVIALVYRRDLGPVSRDPHNPPHRAHPRGLLTIGLLTVLLCSGVAAPVAVWITAATAFLRRSAPPQQIFASIHSELLIFFAALFVVTAAFGQTAHAQALVTATVTAMDGSLARLGITAAVLSNLVSNVPAVLLLQPIIPSFADPERAWVMLAASATMAGNTTLLASVANLIVAERASHAGFPIGFWPYARIGFPITLATLAVTIWWYAGI